MLFNEQSNDVFTQNRTMCSREMERCSHAKSNDVLTRNRTTRERKWEWGWKREAVWKLVWVRKREREWLETLSLSRVRHIRHYSQCKYIVNKLNSHDARVCRQIDQRTSFVVEVLLDCRTRHCQTKHDVGQFSSCGVGERLMTLNWTVQMPSRGIYWFRV